MPTLFTLPFFVVFVRPASVFSGLAFLKRLWDFEIRPFSLLPTNSCFSWVGTFIAQKTARPEYFTDVQMVKEIDLLLTFSKCLKKSYQIIRLVSSLEILGGFLDSSIWDKAFKKGWSKICGRQSLLPQILLGPFLNTLPHVDIPKNNLFLKIYVCSTFCRSKSKLEKQDNPTWLCFSFPKE